ncbi:MAG TPA: hybrid sensor histidine kinase/response regulator [Candidatus Ozemobacteraceae bacterium]
MALEEWNPVILMVDDQPQNLEVLGSILNGVAAMRVARDGQKALEIVQHGIVDLVLLDIEMPGMDGYEVCRRLKADERGAGIPIIFVTGRDQEVDEVRGFEVGAADYVTKPFSPVVVRARVLAHLALRQARKELEKQNQHLRELLKLREEIDRITRHDLKGPLTPILGFPNLLLPAPNLTEDQREGLRAIRSAGYRLLTLINQSLDLYRMETGTYRLQPRVIPVVPIFQTIGRELRELSQSRNSPLEIVNDKTESGDVLSVVGEETLLYSLFTNLLKNAWEATPSGFPVRVALARRPWAEIRVENHGVVPLCIRERFFQKYQTFGKPGGMGLGAYSAHLMTRVMGGVILLEPRDDEERTCIVVHLPLEGVAVPQPALEKGAPSAMMEEPNGKGGLP